MTTGIKDFMINSGLNVPIPEIPIPDLAVPIAAPKLDSIMAIAHPANPKKGAYNGAYGLVMTSEDIIYIYLCTYMCSYLLFDEVVRITLVLEGKKKEQKF